MSTETAMILPSTSAGRPMGAVGAPAGADAQAFLQALLQQQLQGLGGELSEAVQGAVTMDKPGAEQQEDLLAAIVAQLKLLSGTAEPGVAQGSSSGNDAAGGGNILPELKADNEQKSPDDSALAGIAEWLAQFIAPQPSQGASVEGGEAVSEPSVDVASLVSAEQVEIGIDPAAVPSPEEENTDMTADALLRAAFGLDGQDKQVAGKPLEQADADKGAVIGSRFLSSENDATFPAGVKSPAEETPVLTAQRNVEGAPTELSPAAAGGLGPQSQAVSVSTASPRPELTPLLERPITHPAWSQDLGDRVLWMVGQGRQTAELKLNPAHLGPLEVRINLTQDQASIQFSSHQASVLDAVESALPKLREMLGAQQLDLREVSVTPHSLGDQRDPRGAQFAFGQQQPGSGRSETPYPGQGMDDLTSDFVDDNTSAISTRPRLNNGLLSLYA